MNPRPYQQASLDGIIKGFNTFRKQLLVLPTGGGKTCVFSWLAKSFLPQKTLILAHREELIDQAIAKLYSATGIVAQKEKAEFSASLSAEVVVASVQTMIRRLDKWPADHFGLVVADEAHHAISDSWRTVLSHFSGAKILGVTATPDRGDKKNLGVFFENVAHEVPLFDLINQQFLCPISIRAIPLKINLSDVKQTAGDYDPNALDSALAPYMDGIAAAIKEFAADRKTLVFLPLIATSLAFTEILKKHGLIAEHIDGYSFDRKEKLERFRTGETKVLCNAMLLTEGYDEPSIDCVVILRPTRSRPLFSQMAGRGTRICEGKKDLLLLDFLWLHERHTLIRPAHLIAKTDEEAKAMTEMAFGKQEDLDLQGLASETQVEREKKLREELEKNAKRKGKSIDAMDFFLSLHQLEILDYEPEMKWETEPVSEKQRAYLDKMGFDTEEIQSRGLASKMIGKLAERWNMKLATPKQVRLLKRLGYAGAESASLEQAGAFLDRRFGK